jgi:prophage tail gpP-like protein
VSLGKSTDYSERYSEYTVIRQNSRAGEKWKKTDLQQTGIALDLDLTRYRPLIIEAEHKKERGLSLLKKQAAWEAQVRAGRSVVYNYIVNSWFQKDKQGNIIKPWYINQIVNVKDSRRNMDEDLLISELSYMRNESSGPQTRLVLQSQSAFIPPPSNQVSLSL